MDTTSSNRPIRINPPTTWLKSNTSRYKQIIKLQRQKEQTIKNTKILAWIVSLKINAKGIKYTKLSIYPCKKGSLIIGLNKPRKKYPTIHVPAKATVWNLIVRFDVKKE